ncbi:hypothetical protein [Nitrospirillum viridazoti]|uniref:Transcriptional regulator n=1 Tax=Nitrospirillum amazonense TaxID=28077 RepID=A0A560II39_9PROT|nr:hypothetical protein [Nitrospirillum amazonense]TWB58713.1 hypothetical protein FBZ92_109206 [Nitrospirillum amazonense]
MSALSSATEAWGTPPAWVEALARECDSSNQRRAALRVGYSAATVSMVLSNRYKGDLKAVEAAVRDTLMRSTVTCPALGEISGEDCRRHQAAPFSAINPSAVAVFRACRGGCCHSRIGEAS